MARKVRHEEKKVLGESSKGKGKGQERKGECHPIPTLLTNQKSITGQDCWIFNVASSRKKLRNDLQGTKTSSSQMDKLFSTVCLAKESQEKVDILGVLRGSNYFEWQTVKIPLSVAFLAHKRLSQKLIVAEMFVAYYPSHFNDIKIEELVIAFADLEDKGFDLNRKVIGLLRYQRAIVRRSIHQKGILRRRCSNKCSKVKCLVYMKETLPCGHSKPVQCFKTEEEVWCHYPCGKILPCGHECKGTCVSCSNGTLHIKCSSKLHEETKLKETGTEGVQLLRAQVFDKCEAIKDVIRNKFPFADIISHRNVSNLQKFLGDEALKYTELSILLQQLVYLESIWTLRREVAEWENSLGTITTIMHCLSDVEVYLINGILNEQQLGYVSDELSRLEHVKKSIND